ncbi:MAG TPA: transcriptional regulator [Clostridium sp.]|uniref:ArsR/SmtB family transcription factor n=1 Tax=Clostridium lapidicellarium TaxID=3240931 RepID=A0ABV4DXJ3_9CLOT|nr:metalloregulator ArsR/SmtB family transcription factor [uncultured Clostridium sp.]NLU08863.1 helix-turn-helix transcriptional regulator [Clostridiales bacterium]HBC95248.1 transcriptional regulator [Clostridium sp.]
MKEDSEIEVCSCTELHEDCIKSVKESMLDEKVFRDLSGLFKVLGDFTRIKIIYALFKKELCVCDIAEILQMSQSAISHQLRILKTARLVKFRRDGKSVYYSLDDEHINKLFNAGLEHVEHS